MMTSRTLFQIAHAAARSVHQAGESYRTTFGIAYRAAKAATFAVADITGKTILLNIAAAAERIVVALDAGRDDAVSAFLGRLRDPADADRIAQVIRTTANPLLLSDSPRFARLRHFAGIVEAHGAKGAV